MDLFIYNTLSKKKEKFEPIINEKKDFVGIYTCWPTVYSMPHVWNLRAFVFAWLVSDIIRNLLWYKTKHVINITDVGHLTDDADSWEDKLQKTAKEEWKTAWEIASYYEELFKDFIKKLELNFDEIPKATDYIQEQIDIIKELEKNWFTYIIENDWVYFDTSKTDDYGKLIWENREKFFEWIQSWIRVDDTWKRNPTDFALWKFSPIWEKRHMQWDSPWWLWFPGWHIECSAMSKACLWEQFDIHTWWIDHIQTHHTNEIAQSECSFSKNKTWVKYWMHSQFLNSKEWKMSKSKWDILSLPQLEERLFSPYDLRYFFLGAHYRSFLDFDWSAMCQAKKTRHNIAKKLSSYKHIRTVNSSGLDVLSLKKALNTEKSKKFFENISNAILDDINTSKVLAIINENLHDANYELLLVVDWFDKNILKLSLIDLAVYILDKHSSTTVPEYIKQLAQERYKYKLNWDYENADRIRDKIFEQWYTIKDKSNWYDIEHSSL